MKSAITYTSIEEWERAFFPHWVANTEGNKLLQDPHAYAENSIAELTQSMMAARNSKLPSSRKIQKTPVKV